MRINSPPVLLGYQSSKTGGLSIGNQPGKSHTYLQLFVTIEPQLQPAQPMAEKVSWPSLTICKSSIMSPISSLNPPLY